MIKLIFPVLSSTIMFVEYNWGHFQVVQHIVGRCLGCDERYSNKSGGPIVNGHGGFYFRCIDCVSSCVLNMMMIGRPWITDSWPCVPSSRAWRWSSDRSIQKDLRPTILPCFHSHRFVWIYHGKTGSFLKLSAKLMVCLVVFQIQSSGPHCHSKGAQATAMKSILTNMVLLLSVGLDNCISGISSSFQIVFWTWQCWTTADNWPIALCTSFWGSKLMIVR